MNRRITKLIVNNKGLTGSLDVSGLSALDSLDCSNNQLTALDVSRLAAMTFLECRDNKLTALDVSKCIALKYIACYNNKLTALDVSVLSVLTRLLCFDNELTSLNLSNAFALMEVYCENNNLTSLNLSGLGNLTELYCQNNQLAALDVSELVNLSKFECNYNRLTDLDVSALAALTRLNCNNNQLNTLDVSGHVNLTYFDCRRNQLKSLDVSGCTALLNLYCSENQLTALDLSSCTVLTAFSGDEQKPEITLAWNTEIEQYEKAIALNSPAGLDKIIYTEGKLITDILNTVASSPFTVETGNGDRVLGGTISLRYINAPTIYRADDVKALNAIIAAHPELGSEWALAYPDDGSVAPTTPDGTVIWNNNAPKRLTGLDVSGIGMQGRLDLSALVDLTSLDCSGNQLNELNLSGLSLLTAFDGSEQTHSLMLVWSSVKSRYERSIALNNPMLTNGIDYEEGKLTAADKSVASTPFTGETGLDDYTLSGTIHLTYNDVAPVYDMDDVAALNAIINAHSAALGSEWTPATVDDGSVAPTTPAGTVTWDSSNPRRLTKLDIHGKNLTGALYVSAPDALDSLICHSNQLTELTLSGLSALTYLDCQRNQLSALDVSGLVALTYLDCQRNQLSTLNVSGLVALTHLNCSQNRLLDIDLSGLSFLSDFDGRYQSFGLKMIWNSETLRYEGYITLKNPYLVPSVTDIDISSSYSGGKINLSYNHLYIFYF